MYLRLIASTLSFTNCLRIFDSYLNYILVFELVVHLYLKIGTVLVLIHKRN